MIASHREKGQWKVVASICQLRDIVANTLGQRKVTGWLRAETVNRGHRSVRQQGKQGRGEMPNPFSSEVDRTFLRRHQLGNALDK